jgi:hypothetical protein
LVALWSLLTFYHLTYGFVMLVPLAALLLYEGSAHTRGNRRVLFWLLQFGLMFDLPGLWRWFGGYRAASPWLDAVVIHADRVFMLGLFIATARLAIKTARHNGFAREVP